MMSLPCELQLLILQKIDDKSLGVMLQTCELINKLVDDLFYQSRMEFRYNLIGKFSDRSWTKSYPILTSELAVRYDPSDTEIVDRHGTNLPILVKRKLAYNPKKIFDLHGDGSLWSYSHDGRKRKLVDAMVIDFTYARGNTSICDKLFVATDKGQILYLWNNNYMGNILPMGHTNHVGVIKSILDILFVNDQIALLVLLDNKELLRIVFSPDSYSCDKISSDIKAAQFIDINNYYLLHHNDILTSTSGIIDSIPYVKTIQKFGGSKLAILKINGELFKYDGKLSQSWGQHLAIFEAENNYGKLLCYGKDNWVRSYIPPLFEPCKLLESVSVHSAKIILQSSYI